MFRMSAQRTAWRTSLLTEHARQVQPPVLQRIPISKIRPQSYGIRERRTITTTNSIKKVGQLQPIKVRPIKGDPKYDYEVIFGNGRLKAARTHVLALVEECDDDTAILQHITENLVRQNYDAMETANALDVLHKRFHMSTRAIAKYLGSKKSTVHETLQLTKLPPSIQEHVRKGRLTPKHAVLLQRKVPEKFLQMEADFIAKRRMTLDSAEVYLITQEPSYRAHRFATREDTKTRTSSLESEYLPAPVVLKRFEAYGAITRVANGDIRVKVGDGSTTLKELLMAFDDTLQVIRKKAQPGDILDLKFNLLTRIKRKN
jgi:ParB/RepB/Spo0J family partition protein